MKKFGKGMFKDTARVDQPDGTMRDALNANLNDKKGSISNEWGTYNYVNNMNYRVFGRAVLDDDRIILFGQQVDMVMGPDNYEIPVYTDQIRLLNTRNQDVIILYQDPGLNFQQTHPIVTTHRKNQAGEYLVYFTDGYENEEEIYDGFDYVTNYNPPRVINVTKQIQWRFGGGAVNTLYNPTNTYHKLQLIPRVGVHSTFLSANIIEGGKLACAAYYLAVAYADQDGLETNYFVVSNPVYIAPGPENTLPTNSFIGAEGGTPTSKAIRWVTFTPEGIDYQMLQPAVLKLQKNALTAVKIPAVAINRGGNTEITYTGTEDLQEISTDDIVVDDVNYITADSISQLDNRLYLGNVASNKDIGFQPFTHNIQIDTVLDPVENFNPRLYDTFILNQGYTKLLQVFHEEVGQQFEREYLYDPDDRYIAQPNYIDSYQDLLRTYATETFDNSTTRKGYRNPAYSFFRKSYRRGEVYAFYISFVLNDGSETYAYHIPGRLPECVDWETVNNGDTLYEQTSGFVRFTFDYIIGGIATQQKKITFYQVPQNYTLTSGGTLNAGLYFVGTSWNSGVGSSDDVPSNGNWNNGSCPNFETVELTAANFVTSSITSGGPWPSGTPTSPENNILWQWMYNNFPSEISSANLTGDYEEEFLACPVDILTTGYTEGGGSLSGTMCENDRMAFTPYDGTLAAFGFRPEEMLEQNNELDVHQILDTSRQTENTTGYWENSNEFYPNTQDFLLGQVFNDGSTGFDLGPGGTMAGDNVRHHKMPSNLTDSSFTPRETVANRSYPEQARRPYLGGGLSTVTALDKNSSIVTTEDINILGIQLSNLRIPREILQQVQGYKIYYAKRDQKDKTILGQSLAIPGHPRYGASPKQSIEEAVTGPFVKAFYMYGGLDHTDGSSIATFGRWKGAEGELTGPEDNLRLRQYYWSNPVFKFHDFGMLRNRVDLSSVTHVQAQYGVMFRLFQGGPGVFVKACEYDKLWDAPSYFDTDIFDGGNGWAADVAVSNQEDGNVKIFEAHATTFPSLGWVSPEMRNTVDFFWYDPRYAIDGDGTTNKIKKALQNQSHVLDISDGTQGSLTTIYTENGNVIDETAAASGEVGTNAEDDNKQGGKRARKFRRGEDLTQPANDDSLSKPDRVLAIKAKEARVRAFFTSTMVATVYVSPSTVLSSTYIIKAGDFKIPFRQPRAISLQRWYQEDNFDDNQLTLAVEPGGKILLHGRENHSSKDAAAFKGADILFNRSGETAHAFSLISGLPGLKGHAPFYPYNPDNPEQVTIWTTGARPGLIRWGESKNYLYPDAAVGGVPYIWMVAGDGSSGTYQNNNGGQLYDPSLYQGLNYSLTGANHFHGLPMAWLVNVCATRTDVFNPFDRQNLVWTGYYHKIYEPDFETGEAGDFQGNISNYYEGGTSRPIFGGDTYISKYSFRTTSQSYGHSYFRGNRQQGDPIADSVAVSPFGEDEGLADYLNNGAITTAPLRFQGDIPANLNPLSASANPTSAPADGLWDSSGRFGLTSTQPVWNFAHLRALAQGDYEGDSHVEVAEKALNVIQDSRNWVKGDVNPVSTVFTFICETDDLVEFRHVDDEERGESTLFFDYNTAHRTVFAPPTEDLTNPDKLLYGDHYSALQNLKVTSPLPVYAELAKVQRFPNRVVRSDVDSGSLADGFRKFKALEFKDIPTHRGDIKNLFDLKGNLYIHTEKALFVTKGKEELQLSAVTAFIGSGNIFVQDPDEILQSDTGHGGTTSRHAHVTTPYGHFFVNQRDRKIFNLSQQGFQDITNGLESWLRENMPFVVERFGINLDSPNAVANGYYVDASTQVYVPLGFTVGYDPLFKRVLFTKHEPVPTQNFFDLFYSGAIVVYNDIPYRIDTADDNCIEPGTTVTPGEITEDPRGRNQVDNSKLTGEVYCGPIWFGNPYYFTQKSWTISYYPEMQVWGSRHSYGPNLYTNTSEYMVSFAWGSSQDTLGEEVEFYGSWEHSNNLNPGRFYGQVYNFEVEFIDNTGAAESKLFSNMFYWAESFLVNQNSVSEQFRVSNPVFDEFYAYNSTQITGLPKAINYLNNARLVDRIWYVNDIRDMSVQQELDEGELITGTENVAGNITTSVTVHPQGQAMFTEEGVVNNNYVNINKQWYNQRKMIDHYLGVRLIKDNTNRNLVHLYAAGTKFRKSFR